MWPPPRLPAWVGHLAVAWWWTRGHGRKLVLVSSRWALTLQSPCQAQPGAGPGGGRARLPFSPALLSHSSTSLRECPRKSYLPVRLSSFSQCRAGVWKPVCFCLRCCHEKLSKSQALPRLAGHQHAGTAAVLLAWLCAPRDATLPVRPAGPSQVPLWAVACAARGG